MQEKTLGSENFLQGLDSFQARLDAVMREKQISQSDLARLVGTRQSTVQGWLGGSMPRARTLTEIANAINVSEVWLETGKGPVECRTARVEEPVAHYKTNSPAPTMLEKDAYQNLVARLVDFASSDLLAETLTRISSEIPQGNAAAIREVEIFLSMVKDRRPEIFEAEKRR